MTTIHFAQISDIHISSLGDHHEMLSGRAPEIFAGIVTELNQMNDLDFVLITGDLFDTAEQWEFDQFQQVIRNLEKPYYILPGNHDRRPLDVREGLTRLDFARHFNPQLSARPASPEVQVGYWSTEVHPEVQLIGLDSIRDEDWGGIIDDLQLAWLLGELADHPDKLIIVGVHHPLHALHSIDNDPAWQNFVCDNGPEMLALLDDYPQVKMVLTAHHHLTKVDKFGQRWHFANPALVIYPCAYRTFRLTRQDDGWQLQWQMHHTVDEATIAEARELLERTLQDVGFEIDSVKEYVTAVFGTDHDKTGSAILT